MTRIGQIPYLNCEPFFHGLRLEGIELHPMPPRALGPLAQAEELDAGPFSLVQCFDLEDAYEPLGSMGISVKGPVKSILFYSKVPIVELSGATVGITDESATAVQLAKVILEQRYSASPREYVGLEHPDLDAFLLIGDGALLTHDKVEGFPFRYDLAEEWAAWQGLPFVFAMWMVRKALEPEVKEALAKALRDNVKQNISYNLSAISVKRAYMDLTAQEVSSYLKAFRYFLDGEDWRAIEIFKAAWRSLSIIREATR